MQLCRAWHFVYRIVRIPTHTYIHQMPAKRPLEQNGCPFGINRNWMYYHCFWLAMFDLFRIAPLRTCSLTCLHIAGIGTFQISRFGVFSSLFLFWFGQAGCVVLLACSLRCVTLRQFGTVQGCQMGDFIAKIAQIGDKRNPLAIDTNFGR